jgi:hypothetical protein
MTAQDVPDKSITIDRRRPSRLRQAAHAEMLQDARRSLLATH